MPQLETPKPKNKMKTFNWSKLPVNKIFGKNNIWTKVAKTHEKDEKSPIDYKDMEQLFCVQAPIQTNQEKGKDKEGPDKSKTGGEVNLLDGKRSLNINIFLRQFRSSNDAIIEMILAGEHDDIGAEKLRGLIKILPEPDEIEMLKSWDGDTKKLGPAERFILAIIPINNYRLRIESMLLKAEFEANLGFLEPSIESMLAAGQELLTSQKLQSLLYLVLKAGNFLNSGGYAGNAAGMKISSLHKLTDIRSNKPGLNLLHYVAGQVEATQYDLLSITDDLNILEEASKTSIDQLAGDINKLGAQINKVSKQIENPSTALDLRNQMKDFLPYSKTEIECLQGALKDLNSMQSDLAEFFCEEKTFRIEECFKAFCQFNNNFKTAIQDNEKRREQERVAEQRRLQREQEQAKRRSGSYSGGKDGVEEEGEERMVMNNLMHDIKEGFIQRRLPDGGFKQQYSPMVMRKFKKSLDSQLSQASTVSGTGSVSKDSEEELPTPYSTPKTTRRGRGGSFSGPGPGEAEVPSSPGMRRRRSRVPSEEDDKLINYLVSAGHTHDNRERNLSIGNVGEQTGYGSLDRGLLRRSRGRNRPGLLQAELERDRSAPLTSAQSEDRAEVTKAAQTKPPEDPKTKEIKRRVESWLKDSEEDANKAGEYLDKKREKKTLRGSNSDLKNGGGLGTLHEDKPLDAKTIVANTDVISAMEAIEGASLREKQPRKKTPPLSEKEEERKKALIRSLGRRPSEDKVALYVRKQSSETKEPEKAEPVKLRQAPDSSKKEKFLVDMARRSLEVPTDFLDKIDEEKKNPKAQDPVDRNNLPKKYPFNRTTTPNTLREHLKETLVKNIGSTTDLAETIRAFNDDEILDTFNIDSENIETPPVQRRAFRHKSMRLPNNNEDEDNKSDAGSDFNGRRKNHKFRSLTGDGKALGDRELVIKKKKESNNDLSEGRRAATDLEDELGSGLFDRFSSARKTLGRNSLRRKKEEEEDEDSERKLKSDWRSKIANKFRKSSDSYDLVEAERGQELRDYLGMVTPMTEPVRRKPFNIDDLSTPEEKGTSRAEKRTPKTSRGSLRKSSNILEGDYDSTLVDGKYVTSVPIINVEEATEGSSSGNIRPGRSIRDLKSPTDNKKGSSIYDRLARSGSVRTDPSKTSSVYDRLSSGGKSGSRTSLSTSRTTLSTDTTSRPGLTARSTTSRATSLPPDKPKGTLTRIRDISKDLTKNLRKGREDGTVGPRDSPRGSTSSVVSVSSRRPMSNVNGGSHPSINSSTRTLAPRTASKESPRTVRRTTVRSSSTTPLINASSTNSLKRQPRPLPNVKLTNGINGRTTSSKENLSRSSSSTSSVANSNGMSRNTNRAPSSLRTMGSSSSRAGVSTTLPRTRRPTNNNSTAASFMKPTAASAKKVLEAAPSNEAARKTSRGSVTSTRLNPVSAKPSRR